MARQAQERERESSGEGVLVHRIVRKILPHFAASFGQERFERGGVVGCGTENFLGDARPLMQALTKCTEMLGGIFRVPEMGEKKFFRAAA